MTRIEVDAWLWWRFPPQLDGNIPISSRPKEEGWEPGFTWVDRSKAGKERERKKEDGWVRSWP